MALAYLTGSVTMGSADAFAEGEIATALAGLTGVAFQIREIYFEHTFNFIVNSSDAMISLTRRSKTAEPLVTDRDVIAKWKHSVKLATSGSEQWDNAIRYTFTEDDELVIVEDPLYLQIDGTLTAQTASAYCRIGYTRVRISDVDRLTLLTQSLSD